MNPIIRLLSGRPWPARLAILAGVLLVVILAAQLPAETSYAYSAGRAIVFDLGVAGSAGEEVQKREQWEAQAQRILERFRAIGGSTHRVAMMSDPLADNLLGLSGVIFVLDDESTEETAAAQRARERFEQYSGQTEFEKHVQALKEEIELLAGGADERSRNELNRARAELLRARGMLAEVLEGRDGKLEEASGLLETRLRLMEELQPDAGQTSEIRLQLQRVLEEQDSLMETQLDPELLRLEIQRIVSEEQSGQDAIQLEGLARLEILGGLKDMPVLDGLEELKVLEELDIEALVREILALHDDGFTEDLTVLEFEEGLHDLESELERAFSDIVSVDVLREAFIKELKLEEDQLEELLSMELQEMELDKQDLDELREFDHAAALAELQEMELELQAGLEEMRLELQSLEAIDLEGLLLELQELDELKDIMLELELPEGELLELTMLEELHEVEEAGKVSFRFRDHLFSFPRNTPARKMAATVNKWLKENGYDCEVKVVLGYDDKDRVSSARAVVKE